MMRIRYHAAARELAGCSEETVGDWSDVTDAELRSLLAHRHPSLAPYLGRMRLARNEELSVTPERFFADDVVDVLPPVAGGSASAPHVSIRDTPLSLDQAYAAVAHPAAGGVCLFIGVVRNHADGEAVVALDYEAADSLALKEAERVLHAVAADMPGVRLCAMHRVGALVVGDIAVVVAAAAAHRAEAFAACRRAIDDFKESVPIWKREHRKGRPALWVNLEGGEGEDG